MARSARSFNKLDDEVAKAIQESHDQIQKQDSQKLTGEMNLLNLEENISDIQLDYDLNSEKLMNILGDQSINNLRDRSPMIEE